MASVALNCELTDEARRRFLDMSMSGRGFTVTYFQSGEGGHDPANPSMALQPQVEVLELPSATFGPKPITGQSAADDYTASYVVDFAEGEAIGTLSNIGLYATIDFAKDPLDPLLGTSFLYAIANMPIQTRIEDEERTFELLVYY